MNKLLQQVIVKSEHVQEVPVSPDECSLAVMRTAYVNQEPSLDILKDSNNELVFAVLDGCMNPYNDLEKFVKEFDTVIYPPAMVKKEITFFHLDKFILNVVTDEEIENIARFPIDKIKSQKDGTFCHQCKEKTLDTKSFCHNPKCTSDGQLCGLCLQFRYGEDLETVLKDITWICPYCRGVCNCSSCRALSGKVPAENLVFIALGLGFKSVHHFLRLLKD